jgi:tetratricopeptide (TPR) repeat protein
MTKKTLVLSITLLSLVAVLFGQTRSTLAETPAKTSDPLRYRFADSGTDSAPVELTAADGTGLKLELYQAKTVIQGPLAFTELRLTFHNPEDREREGRFRITLPDQAAISRFAMRIDDKWQEAEMVERQAARRAYEDFLHRRQDPALLEKAAGNEFRARVFPIPANGQKELILSFSQELQSDQQFYTLPLKGLPLISDFEIEVQLEREGKRQELVIKEKNYAPPGDFQLAGLTTEPVISSGSLLVARVTPELSAKPEAPEDLLILIDTSASRALGQQSQQQMVSDLVKKMPSVKQLTVAGFDQEVIELYSGPPADLNWSKQEQRGAFGATNLASAIEWAARQKGHTRLLVVTDGVSTAGDPQLSEILKGSSIQRVDAIVTGGIRDKAKMDLLVESGNGREGIALVGTATVEELAKALSSSVTSGVDVSMQSALWTWPTTLNNLQPGDQRLIYAQFPEGHTGTYTLSVGGQTRELNPTVYDASPLLERSAAVAQIASWEADLSETDDPELQEELSEKIVDLSKTKRVLSDKTALLVLETEDDYRRFEIDRNALSDILTVGKSGLELTKRKELAVAPVVANKVVAKPEKKEDADKGIGDTERVPMDGSAPLAEPAQDENMAPESPAPAPATATRATGIREPRARRVPSRPQSYSADVAAEEENSPSGEVSMEETDEDGMEDTKRSQTVPLTGKFAEIDTLLNAGKKKQALAKARSWQKSEPGNVLALIALGNCLEAMGKMDQAARVFGSIIDLFPSRADLRRYAGSRLQALDKAGLELAVDSFRKAVEQRPDHVSSHRFLAFALARQADYPAAMEALEAGLSRNYPSGRFESYERILKDDLGLLAAAWKAKEPGKKSEIYARLKKYDAKMAKGQSLRFILTWETDANDVDFHIRDSEGGHAYYSEPILQSGGELYGDVTTGYGPECFAIEGAPKAQPYELEIHYYSRGPMGYGMGQLEVLKHDGEGKLTFEGRPYVVMEDGAYVNLGTVGAR